MNNLNSLSLFALKIKIQESKGATLITILEK